MPRLLARHLFLTGQPGVGKTTLACTSVQDVPACGFYTEECRSGGGDRQGFDVVVLGSDERGPLARLGSVKPCVGKYSVQVASFERLALPSLDAAGTSAITLIDEVGKMELYSEAFLPRVEAVLNSPSATVLGTLPMPRYGHVVPAVEAVRNRPDVAVVKLVKANRDAAAVAVRAVVKAAAAAAAACGGGGGGGMIDVTALAEFLQEGQADKLLRASLPREPPCAAPAVDGGGGGVGVGVGGGGGCCGGGDDDGCVTAPQPKRQQRQRAAGPTRPVEEAAAAAAAAGAGVPEAAPPLVGAAAPRCLLLGETASPAVAAEGGGGGELAYADRSMWPVLRVALGLSDNTDVRRVKAAALGAGVAVWDVLANVHVKGQGSGGGGDRKRGGASAERPNDVGALLAAHPTIGTIGFIGQKAYAAFVRHHPQLVDAHQARAAAPLRLVVLPSSSRANAVPLAQKAAEWRRVLLELG